MSFVWTERFFRFSHVLRFICVGLLVSDFHCSHLCWDRFSSHLYVFVCTPERCHELTILLFYVMITKALFFLSSQSRVSRKYILWAQLLFDQRPRFITDIFRFFFFDFLLSYFFFIFLIQMKFLSEKKTTWGDRERWKKTLIKSNWAYLLWN